MRIITMFGSALALLAVLGGCSTTPMAPEQAKAVPADRILYAGAGNASVVVTRDGGLIGSACYLAVLLDGQLAARVGPGETVTFRIPAGEHLVGMAADPLGSGLCGLGGMAMREVSATVAPEQTKRFRVLGDMSGGFTISPSSL